jgi:tetratricopeptide (TPR) repeat protein
MVLLGAAAALKGRASAKAPSFGEIARASRAIEEWRVDDAAPLVAELEKSSPGDPQVVFLRAELDYLQGHYKEAIVGLKAIKAPELRSTVKELLPLYESTEDATRGMLHKTSPSGHFEIYYVPGKDEVLVDLAAETLDLQWQALKDDLGYAPAEQIRIELLPKITDLARVSTLSEKAIETSGTIALCKYQKLMVVTPRATIFGYPWRDTLAHELTHYFVTRLTDDKTPIWLHEGLAKYEETRWRAAPGAAGMGRVNEHLLAVALKKGRLITFEQMHPSMAYLPSQEAAATAFAEVWAFVDWLDKKQGMSGIRGVLARLKDGKSDKRAIAEVTGVKWEVAEATWKKWLRGLNLRADPMLGGDAGQKIRFKKGEGDDENVGVDRVAETARKHARLGGLLRARGRLAAAAAEYEKAVAITGPTDPFLSSKLARTYLELGDPQKAVSVLEAVPDRDPDDEGPEATLGSAYLALGDADKAREHFEIALRVQPFDPAVRCGLADVYRQKGDAALATREDEACRVVKGVQ